MIIKAQVLDQVYDKVWERVYIKMGEDLDVD